MQQQRNDSSQHDVLSSADPVASQPAGVTPQPFWPNNLPPLSTTSDYIAASSEISTSGAFLPIPSGPSETLTRDDVLTGLNDFSFWSSFAEGTAPPNDVESLPFIDWARDSALDFTGNITEWLNNDAIPLPLAQPASPPTITADEVHAKVDAYFQQIYPMMPVLNETRIRAQIPSFVNGMISCTGSSGRADSTSKMLESILAIIESSKDHSKNKALAPRLARLSSQAVSILEINNPSVDMVMHTMHLFVALQSSGERAAAWYHLQQAMTQILMLGQPNWSSLQFDEEHARLYLILFISERAMVALQQIPASIDRPLRLPDDAYLSATSALNALPQGMLADFPMSHLRLFSLIKSTQAPCWRSTCGGARRCTAWTADMAIYTMQCFAGEMRDAKQIWATKTGLNVQSANLVITVAWLRDRFWNIFLRHGLIGDVSEELGFGIIDSNLSEVADFCMGIKSAEFDKGVDCNAKLFDMAMTATALVRVFASRDFAGSNIAELVASDVEKLTASLTSSAYRVLGLLTMLGQKDDSFCNELSRALASVR